MKASKQPVKQDSSLQKKHTATLAELERYKLLIASVEDYAIFMIDPDGYVMTWNKGAEKNKGYTAEEIIGKHFSNFYQEADKIAKKPERELELARKYGRVEDEDWRVRKDGSRFWANVVITALYEDDGRLVGFAKVTRDLTERKQHEDALREANSLLKRQQKELQELSISKDEFISLASHQLRTPATIIKQLLGIMLDGITGPLSPEHVMLLQKAFDSNERQIHIVNSLLKVAQIDAGKVVLHKTAVDVADTLRQIVSDHSDIFKSRQHTATVTAPAGLPPVVADRDHLRMALENIVDNASKYTPDGGNITLTAKAQDASIIVEVRDTGVGIAPADVGKLFTKFSRIPNELSDRVSGSGLGLYWVEKIIALHGGQISVTSDLHMGTAFTITLPIRGQHA